MKKKVLSLVLVMVTAVAMLAGCGSKSADTSSDASADAKSEDAKEDDYVVRIPVSQSLCSSPIQMSVINGYFDQVGLKWEEVSLGDNSSLDLVAAGKADVSYDLLQTLVQRIASGLDYSVITGVHYGCINVVATDTSGIKTVADLKGKKIGCPVSLGSDPSVMLQRVLTDAGIGCTADNMEVDLQVFANADLETAMQNGSIDAFVSWDPYASLVAKNHNYPIVWSQTNSEMTKDEYCCFLGFRTEFVEQHPEEAAKVCEAVDLACKYINENPEEAVQKSIDNQYVALKDVELGAELLKSYKYGLNVEGGKESFKNCTQSLLDLGIISLNQTVDEFTEDHYPAVKGVEY